MDVRSIAGEEHASDSILIGLTNGVAKVRNPCGVVHSKISAGHPQRRRTKLLEHGWPVGPGRAFPLARADPPPAWAELHCGDRAEFAALEEHWPLR